jgi:hypothetical protein
MKILIHVTAQGPVGAWRYISGGLESYYSDNAAQDDQGGAESMLNLKPNSLSWDQWFDKLVDRSPYFIKFQQVEAGPREAVADVLERVQREYSGL